MTPEDARRLTGVSQVHAVLGGFHLGGPVFEPLIPQVCAELERLSPAVIVPAHCTGWAAQRAFAHRARMNSLASVGQWEGALEKAA